MAANWEHCKHCGTRVRGQDWAQHAGSKRHMSFLYFGHAGEHVRNIAIDKPGGGMRYLRPADVPHHVVNVARRARELALSGLFLHSGQALFERASVRFAPEQLCASMLQEEGPQPELDAEAIICLAAELEARQITLPKLAGSPREELEILVAPPMDQARLHAVTFLPSHICI